MGTSMSPRKIFFIGFLTITAFKLVVSAYLLWSNPAFEKSLQFLVEEGKVVYHLQIDLRRVQEHKETLALMEKRIEVSRSALKEMENNVDKMTNSGEMLRSTVWISRSAFEELKKHVDKMTNSGEKLRSEKKAFEKLKKTVDKMTNLGEKLRSATFLADPSLILENPAIEGFFLFHIPVTVITLHLVWLPLMLYSPWTAVVVFSAVEVAAANVISEDIKLGFVKSILDVDFVLGKAKIDSLFSTPVLLIINFLYIGCIMAIVIIDHVNDDRKNFLKCREQQLQVERPKVEEAPVFKDFMTACSSGENKTLLRSFLHDPNFNPNQRHPVSGDTGLHVACRHGQLSVVQAILDVKKKAINLNIEDGAGHTPLMIVAAKGDKTMLARLFKMAKLKLKNQCGEKAICLAVENEHYIAAQTICEELKKRGLMLKHPSISSYLNRCVDLTKDKKRTGLTEGQRKTIIDSFKAYKSQIMTTLRPSEKLLEKLSQEGVMAELKEFLECSICFEEFGDLPILACSNDHWMCSKCVPKHSLCPYCREPFGITRPPKRCRTSEKIMKLVAMIEM
jgi:hypothetical protein